MNHPPMLGMGVWPDRSGRASSRSIRRHAGVVDEHHRRIVRRKLMLWLGVGLFLGSLFAAGNDALAQYPSHHLSPMDLVYLAMLLLGAGLMAKNRGK